MTLTFMAENYSLKQVLKSCFESNRTLNFIISPCIIKTARCYKVVPKQFFSKFKLLNFFLCLAPVSVCLSKKSPLSGLCWQRDCILCNILVDKVCCIFGRRRKPSSLISALNLFSKNDANLTAAGASELGQPCICTHT